MSKYVFVSIDVLQTDCKEADLTASCIKDIIDDMSCFVMILSPDSEIVYITENVKTLLGLSQVTLNNPLIYAHPYTNDRIKSVWAPRDSVMHADISRTAANSLHNTL